MNAGKSALLLLCNHNYISNNMHTLLMTPEIDTRDGVSKVKSRIGLESEAQIFKSDDNLYDMAIKNNNNCFKLDYYNIIICCGENKIQHHIFEPIRVCKTIPNSFKVYIFGE